jgi:hypothetical protein
LAFGLRPLRVPPDAPHIVGGEVGRAHEDGYALIKQALAGQADPEMVAAALVTAGRAFRGVSTNTWWRSPHAGADLAEDHLSPRACGAARRLASRRERPIAAPTIGFPVRKRRQGHNASMDAGDAGPRGN